MSTPARVVQVADAIVARITDGWPDPPPAAVSREWLVVTKLQSIVGRNVWVFSAAYGIGSVIDRGENENDNTYGIVVAERFTDAGEIPDDWIDERVRWTEQAVWAAVSNIRTPLIVDGSNVWSEVADVSVYDPELLRGQKLFWSEITVTFREVTEPVAVSL